MAGHYLRKDQLFGPGDALFPKLKMSLKKGSLAWEELSRETYGTTGTIREVIKTANTDAGLPPFGPHSLRKTRGILANDFCKTPEQFQAWSMNLGHESIATTLSAYCPVSPSRQAELIRGCCQTNANQSPFPLPHPPVGQRKGRATLRERRHGPVCRRCDLGGDAPLGSGCGPRHALKRISVRCACGGAAAWLALVAGMASINSQHGC